jgi:hypothetical protein
MMTRNHRFQTFMEIRRAELRAELDAYYARLYGLTRDEFNVIGLITTVHSLKLKRLSRISASKAGFCR